MPVTKLLYSCYMQVDRCEITSVCLCNELNILCGIHVEADSYRKEGFAEERRIWYCQLHTEVPSRSEVNARKLSNQQVATYGIAAIQYVSVFDVKKKAICSAYICRGFSVVRDGLYQTSRC